jgi:hypothetical protein
LALYHTLYDFCTAQTPAAVYWYAPRTGSSPSTVARARHSVSLRHVPYTSQRVSFPTQVHKRNERYKMGCTNSKAASSSNLSTAEAGRPTKAVAQLRAKDGSTGYFGYEALLHSVESGAVAPLRGSWLLKLYESGGRLSRRQDLPPEAFWSAAELRGMVDAACRHFCDDEDAARAALGHLFNALSYRWPTELLCACASFLCA